MQHPPNTADPYSQLVGIFVPVSLLMLVMAQICRP